MIGFIKHILALLLLLLPIILMGQTKEDLKKQKSEIEKEISYTTELLNKTKLNKTKSINYLKVLESQINSQEQLLATLNIEIELLTKQIKITEISIIETEKGIKKDKKRLRNLKDEYAKMIYAVFKQKNKRNNIMFIVSSADFNQAYKRILYLQQYAVVRKNQAKKIEASQRELIAKKEKLAQQKDRLIEESATKILLVSSKKNEIKRINRTKDEKQILLKKLTKSEIVFKNQIQEKQNKAKEVEKKIRKIIAEEIAKSKKKNIRYNLTPESLALSKEFENNEGKLPWPVEKGVIVSGYGKQKHIVFQTVETFNNGIDIATNKDTDVRSVFDGTVSRIFFIKGEGKAVLINHGEYFSVYSGLKQVLVKAGERISLKDKIGVVITHEEESRTELHFEIWKGYEKQNPSKWLYNAD